MAKTPLLWRSTARKEALELLEHLWAQGDEAVRQCLSDALVEGPPDHLGPSVDLPDERQRSRDRRMFDRIGLLERDGTAPLTPVLAEAMAQIRQREPQWTLAIGDQARFSWWMEFGAGDRGEPHLERLASLTSVEALAAYLIENQHDDPHEGLLGAWRRFAIDSPERALGVLSALAEQPDGGAIGLWRVTLWGLRDHAKDESLLRKALIALLAAPLAHFTSAEFNQSVADLLEAGATGTKAPLSEDFWRVFDLSLAHASADPANLNIPDDGQWVGLAINRSMGHLASALFNGLFAYRLKVNDTIPAQHRHRLGTLLGLGQASHRPARVIAASRLPYLFAVDPEWSRNALVPLLDWDRDELEATAAWQGFAWHPRIGDELWDLIKPHFLAAFTPERLGRFGASRTTMAQLVMLGGLEFDLGPDQARTAIRAMTDEMRGEAIWWLWNDLSRASDDGENLKQADERWSGQVEPWLTKTWPRDPALKTRRVGQHFALLPCATDIMFPRSVAFVIPFVVRGDGGRLLDRLTQGFQADRYPAATLDLLSASLDLNQWIEWSALTALLDRIAAADAHLRDLGTFRDLQARTRVGHA